MMQILAHRGLWKDASEQNTMAAFQAAIDNGFGIETDIRDCNGSLVISHDMPHDPGLLRLEDFLGLVTAADKKVPLALNIKADGLQQPLQQAVDKAGLADGSYFFFDMSVPDALGYLARELPCFTRFSEVEPTPSFLDAAKGVWVDSFYDDFDNPAVIEDFLSKGLQVALVSPELHRRPHLGIWQRWRDTLPMRELMLCTDYPFEAKAFFDE